MFYGGDTTVLIGFQQDFHLPKTNMGETDEYDNLDDADTNERWDESETNGMESTDVEDGSNWAPGDLETPAGLGHEGLEMLEPGVTDTEWQLDDTTGDGQVRYNDGRELDGDKA